ncbi:MAG: 30S ribosomal protein S6 [Alphaproteobacteria bacterium]|nr:30S ribosomal protein S6 [Alphaproteobacteria bacterium]
MPFYESTFIVRPDASNQQVEAITATMTELVQNNGGKVAKSEYWGLKSLSYRIKKNRKGHYVMLGLDAPSPAVDELERNLRINEDVVRYLTVRVEAMDETPTVMMQAKHGRDDRRRDERDGRDGRDGRRGRFDGDGPDREGERE